jgi:hypothetical protein
MTLGDKDGIELTTKCVDKLHKMGFCYAGENIMFKITGYLFSKPSPPPYLKIAQRFNLELI